MGRYIRGSVDEDLSLGTLAGKTLAGTAFDQTVNERTWCSSIRASWTIANWTHIASSGPLVVGVAHGDYSDAEIEAWIETTDSWDEGNLIEQEVGARKIRRIGVFEADSVVGAIDQVALNDGKQITTKLGWMLLQGQTLRIWAYNTGTAALATTVPTIHAAGHVNLWPR